MSYKLATGEELEEIREIAEDWFKRQNPGNMFIDSRSASVGAVMEFLANQYGSTLFTDGVGKNEEIR